MLELTGFFSFSRKFRKFKKLQREISYKCLTFFKYFSKISAFSSYLIGGDYYMFESIL